MLNKVMIIGRLGKDPEVRQGQSGAICNFTVATDESYSDRNTGQRIEKTEWHRVSTFGKTAENVGRFLGKGSLVYVEGKLQTRKWTDQTGQDRYTTEILANVVRFLDKKSDQQKPQQGGHDDYSFYSGPALKDVEEPPF